MITKNLETLVPEFLSRLERDGYSEEVKATNRWVTHHFQKYCQYHGMVEITMETITDFLKVQYDIDLYKPISASQIAIRRPLLIFWEYSLTGTYKKSHLCEKTVVPPVFHQFYLKYCAYINSLALNVNTKTGKARFAKQFLVFLSSKGVDDISSITLWP